MLFEHGKSTKGVVGVRRAGAAQVGLGGVGLDVEYVED